MYIGALFVFFIFGIPHLLYREMGSDFLWWFFNILGKPKFDIAVTIGYKERLDSEQPGNSEPFSVPILSVYFINIKQTGVSEQFCDTYPKNH